MVEEHDVVIVGAGFAGLAMAIRLREAGMDDFVILEAGQDLGGTWRDNTYPGAACDVPSHLYSYSFEMNPRWSRMFSPQREILEYMRHCATKYGVASHLRFRERVARARFDERAGAWTIETAAGTTLRARALVTATGGLSRPSMPDIPGLARFAGRAFHSARWAHDYDLRGKHVAVIGTGASAIQIVPAIQPEVAKLTVFQRTPPWILPKPDFEIARTVREALARLPGAERGVRETLYWLLEALAVGFVIDPRLMKPRERRALAYLAREVRDPSLREKLTPRYSMGCKRVLFTNDWYRTLQSPNVELVSEGIDQVTPAGVLTRDRRERAFDAIVLATGFVASEALAPFDVEGRDGRRLADEWRDGAEAYLGTTVSGYPNLFTLIGPNTGLGHTSMILMMEAQVAYVMGALRTMRDLGAAWVDVRKPVQADYNRELQSRLRRSVWASGCTSWYLTRDGRNTTVWPGFTWEYALRTRRFDTESYELGTRGELDAARASSPALATPSRAAAFGG